MFKKISENIFILQSWKTILFFGVICLVINSIVFPYLGAEMKGQGPIDLTLYYTSDEVYRMVKSYGEEGRDLYAIGELTADTIYPISYGLFFSLSISFFLQKATTPNQKIRLLNLIPLFTALLDFGENACIVSMLKLFPQKIDILNNVSAVFTFSKWLFVVLSVAALLYAVVYRIATKDK